MVSLHHIVAALIIVAACMGTAAAQEPSADPKPAQSTSSKDKPEPKGIDCRHGIACPIISIPIPDVPLDTPKPSAP
jgi:hypothetical protein